MNLKFAVAVAPSPLNTLLDSVPVLSEALFWLLLAGEGGGSWAASPALGSRKFNCDSGTEKWFSFR